MSINVIVFGSNGMLGRYVCKYLKSKQTYNVIKITKENIDLSKSAEVRLFISTLNQTYEPDAIVNCAGIIKHRPNISMQQYIQVNVFFVSELSIHCIDHGIPLYHITTDCVYSGSLESGKSYIETDPHDYPIDDNYAFSKSISDSVKCSIIRTSIIGEEKRNKLSLIEWIKSKKNKQVVGYTNHLWNGMTCLQLAKILHLFIENQITWVGVRHLFSQSVTKHTICKIVNEIYSLNIDVKEGSSSTPVNRTLGTIAHHSISSDDHIYIQINELMYLHIPPIRDQLEEQFQLFPITSSL